MRPSCAVLVCVAFPLGTFGFGRLSFTRGAAPNATADPCDNYHESCAGWADAGECESNRPYMYASCRLACGMCTRREGSTASSIASRLIRLATSRTTSSTSSTSSSPRPPAPLPSRQKPPSLRHECRDVSREECERRMSAGECDSHEGEMLIDCPRTCRVCNWWPLLREAFDCDDMHEACVDWSRSGECERNPAFMREQCPASCDSCEQKRMACNRPPRTPPAVTSGGINKTFSRILREFPQYNPKVISRPGASSGRAPSRPSAGGLVAPWVLTLEKFVSDAEADAFVKSCESHFERSLAGDQLSPVRTSQQCWCSHNECDGHPLTKAVEERIANLTQAPIRYMEPFQILKYKKGQFYKRHHDQNSGLFTPQGPRIYTFFMYLSTPEAGGGTRFNDLDVVVPAIKGNAVMWPSVRDADPRTDEPYTNHEAVPVEEGTKYAANVWVHNYDFRTPATAGCVLTHKNTH